MTRRISILNFKGGVGKTSIAINLAYALSLRDKRVIIIDCDRQRNASSLLPEKHVPTLLEVLLGQSPLKRAIYEARTNVFVVPAHSDLEKAATHIQSSGPRTLKLLHYSVQELTGYDYIFFDHAPSYSKLTDAALFASDEMLIPVQLEPFSIEGLLDMIQKLTQTLGELEHEVQIAGIVPNNLNYSKSMTLQYLNSLKKRFGGQVTTSIRTDAQISKSQSKHLSIFEYDPHAKGTEDFTNLAEHLLIGEEVRVS